jgi:hypothetical protein
MLFNEKHGNNMTNWTHNYLHLTQGTKLLSGCGITTGSDISWTTVEGTILDEDLSHTISA